jgi:hypothetical protein
MVGAVSISTSIVLIAGMLLAALAFANGVSLTVPLIASFDGSRSLDDSPAVTVDGSWIAATALVLTLALPMCIFAVRYRRDPA